MSGEFDPILHLGGAPGLSGANVVGPGIMTRKNMIMGLVIMALTPTVTGLNETLCDLGLYEYCEPEHVWALNQTSLGSCPNQTSARDLMARSWCDFGTID